ncbi:hypothetical protein E4U33_000340 [Claviceps sp. LM78 group G4]|nr:hypothetical protein E4U33_000340 [Claviceps sp. LM78 group G4]
MQWARKPTPSQSHATSIDFKGMISSRSLHWDWPLPNGTCQGARDLTTTVTALGGRFLTALDKGAGWGLERSCRQSRVIQASCNNPHVLRNTRSHVGELDWDHDAIQEPQMAAKRA